MGISRVSAYELVHTPGFPSFRSGRLIKVSKKAFFDWMERGTETVPKDNKIDEYRHPDRYPYGHFYFRAKE